MTAAVIIRGAGTGKQGNQDQHTPTEAPNTLQSNSIARVIDLISEGEIEGIVGGLQGIKFDGTPLQNTDGSFNYQNVQIDARVGLPDQAFMPGFSDVETEIAVGAQITYNVPAVRTIDNLDATSVRVTVQIPALSIADQSTGDINPTAVGVWIEVQANGDIYRLIVNDVIQGKTSSAYQRSYRLSLYGTGPWNLRVSRTTLDSTSSLIQNQTYWASYTVIEDFKLSYPDSALVATAVDAQSFGNAIPTRTFVVKGIKVQVPANYDPATRSYASTGPGTSGGAWDGTFKTAWTDNPAWVWFDLVTNERYGIGQFIGPESVDKFGLYAIAQYCDDLVPDGFGGMEPRYTFNGVIATADDALKVLTTVASSFRGMVYWGPNGAAVACDMPADPVKLVSPANVINDPNNGCFNYEGTALKARHSVVFVTWYDPSNSYQPNIEVVEDQDAIDRFGWRLAEIVAYGCTSRGRAHRFGRWLLDSEKNETETCTWVASWDQADVAPGDIVSVADPAIQGTRLGGRIAALTLNGAGAVTGITIDAPVTIASGHTYTCSMMLPDGRIVDRVLSNAPGQTANLTFVNVLPDHPLIGAMWVLGSDAVAPRQFRVIAKTETDKHLFQITALLHDPTKFARIEQNIALEAPFYTTIPTGPLLPPSGLSLRESVTLAGGSVARAKATISWVASPDPRVIRYEVQSQPPDQNWQPAGYSDGLSIDLFDLTAGTWGFRVRSVDALGRTSPTWETVEGLQLLGLLLPPADVTGARAVFVDNNQSVAWDEILDYRPIRYAVRKGDSWDTGLELGTVAHPPLAAHGNGLYWIKAYTGPDASRVYSVNAISIEIAGVTLVSNVIAIRDESGDAWPGVFSGTVGKSGSFIRTGGSADLLSQPDFLGLTNVLDLGGQGDGAYEMDPSRYIDAGRVAPCRVTMTWKGTALQVGQDILSNADMLNMPDFLGNASSDLVEVYTEISISQTHYVGDVYALDPTRNPANDVYAEDDIYSPNVSFAPWQRYEPGDYLGRVFRGRVVLKTHDQQTQAIGLEFQMQVDVPDRLDTWGLIGGTGTSLTGITIPDTGLPIVFASNGKEVAEAFNGGPGTDTLPHIQITNLNGQAYDFSMSSFTKSGVTLFANQSGVPVSAPNSNIQIQGY